MCSSIQVNSFLIFHDWANQWAPKKPAAQCSVGTRVSVLALCLSFPLLATLASSCLYCQHPAQEGMELQKACVWENSFLCWLSEHKLNKKVYVGDHATTSGSSPHFQIRNYITKVCGFVQHLDMLWAFCRTPCGPRHCQQWDPGWRLAFGFNFWACNTRPLFQKLLTLRSDLL